MNDDRRLSKTLTPAILAMRHVSWENREFSNYVVKFIIDGVERSTHENVRGFLYQKYIKKEKVYGIGCNVFIHMGNCY